MFRDDQGSWPDKLWIRGFTYEGLGDRIVGTRVRLQWLRLHQGRFAPQIYDRLADAYQRADDDGAARKAAVAKQWRRRKPYNPLSWLWRVTVGFGYRTWQAFIWAAVPTVTGTLVFSDAYPAHMVKLTTHPPRFPPVIYALDVLLPIGGLGPQRRRSRGLDGHPQARLATRLSLCGSRR